MVFSLVQSRLNLSRESVVVMAGILLYLIPFALTTLLLWKRKTWRPNMVPWRWRLWNGGLAVGAVSAIATPVFLVGLQFLSNNTKQRWFIEIGTKGMFFAFLIAPVAVILLGFGGGKQRWWGMFTATLTFVELYISLLAASY